MFSVLVAGHVCLDLVPVLREPPKLEPGGLAEIGPLAVRSGGCVANTGGDLADLGIPVRLAADVGSDVLGDTLLDVLRERGLRTAELRRTRHSTSYSIVVQPPGRDRAFWHHVGANRHFDGRSLDLGDCDLLHVGYPSILPALAVDRGRALVQLLQRARRTEITTSLDLAVVDHHATDNGSAARHGTWREVFEAVLPVVDVISPSVDDLTSATGREVAQAPQAVLELAGELVDQGVAIAMVSAGGAGMALATGPAHRLRAAGRVLSALDAEWADLRCWHAVEAVAEPITTRGAGDAATAGLLAGLVRGAGPDSALDLAAATARARILGHGLSVPTAQP